MSHRNTEISAGSDNCWEGWQGMRPHGDWQGLRPHSRSVPSSPQIQPLLEGLGVVGSWLGTLQGAGDPGQHPTRG